jgi:hypothetical protein
MMLSPPSTLHASPKGIKPPGVQLFHKFTATVTVQIQAMGSDPVAAEIQRRVFEAVVPLRLIIDSVDIPFCFNAPRCVSLGSFIYARLAFFLGRDTPQLWVSHNNMAVKWQLPIGCIYDALVPSDSAFVPLCLQIRLSNFPEGKVLRCESMDTVLGHFCHSFKESLFLTQGSLDLIQNNAGLHQNIAKCVNEGDFNTFRGLFDLRMGQKWKVWPIKFVEKETLNVSFGFLEVSGEEQTIKDVLAIKSLARDQVIVHGIPVDAGSKLNEIVGVMLNPDGFFYAVI